MKKIILSRRSVHWDSLVTSYKLVLEVVSSEGITKSIFVKQRIRNPGNATFNDVFAAVATPVQLEDLDENSPAAETTFFRVSKIELTGASSGYIETVFNDIVSDIQRLVGDLEILDDLAPDGLYTIEADNIDINMGTPHTHYRIPLFAQPAGTNVTFVDIDSQTKQQVGSQDVSKQGWLNSTYLNIYKFKYNIDTDATLSLLWPIDENLISNAHIEVNGITTPTSNVKIDSTGIYWKDNLLGYAPWPVDYVSPSQTGAPETQVTLVFDFIN